jgi:hypothetical protein
MAPSFGPIFKSVFTTSPVSDSMPEAGRVSLYAGMRLGEADIAAQCWAAAKLAPISLSAGGASPKSFSTIAHEQAL